MTTNVLPTPMELVSSENDPCAEPTSNVASFSQAHENRSQPVTFSVNALGLPPKPKLYRALTIENIHQHALNYKYQPRENNHVYCCQAFGMYEMIGKQMQTTDQFRLAKLFLVSVIFCYKVAMDVQYPDMKYWTVFLPLNEVVALEREFLHYLWQ